MTTPEELIKYIEQVKSGNKEAFTKVYEQSYPYLHTCVIHIVKDEDTAQDMLQETYVEIFKNIGQLKSSADFLSWAATIANRKCFAYLKKDRDILVDEQTDDEGKETDFFESLADDEAFIPENIFDNKEKIKIIRDIIDSLSDVQRACVIGFYYNEQKQEEIADELGIPVNTVKSHLNRAKAKIKDSVNDVEKKQDVKLYSIAPFMLLLFGHEAKEYVAKTAIPAMSGMTMAASAGAKVAGAAVKIKVLAAAIAGVAVIGGITGVALHHRMRPAPVVETVSEEVEAEPVVEPATTETTEATETTETTEAAEETVSEEELQAEIPAAVRNDVKFENSRDFDSFIWINFTKKQGNEWQFIDNPECTYKDASAKFQITEVTEKDIDDNNKEYTVVLNQEFAYKVCYPVELDPLNWFYSSDVLTFFDYYTGNVMRTADSLRLDVGENSTGGSKDNVVLWNGNDYPVSISVEKERTEGPQEFIDDGPAGTYVTGLSSEVTYTYKISCPKDYDGLCMCLIKPSALPADAAQQATKMYYAEDGMQVTNSSDDGKDFNLFENEYNYGITPSSDTLHMMRVDDMASKQ